MPVATIKPTFSQRTPSGASFEETRRAAKMASGVEKVCDKARDIFNALVKATTGLSSAQLRTAASIGYLSGAIIAASIFTGKVPPSRENLEYVASAQKESMQALVRLAPSEISPEQMTTTFAGLAGGGMAMLGAVAVAGIVGRKKETQGLALDT